MAKIITVPDPKLRETCELVEKVDKQIKKIIKDLESTLSSGKNPRGVGLSAIQLGIPIRILSSYLPLSGDPDDYEAPILQTYINPKITVRSEELTLGNGIIQGKTKLDDLKQKKPIYEGCLSIPNIWGPIWRSTWVEVEWLDRSGEPKQERFRDFHGRVLQHEIDHFDGILFTDYSIRDNLPLFESKGDRLVPIEMPKISK